MLSKKARDARYARVFVCGYVRGSVCGYVRGSMCGYARGCVIPIGLFANSLMLLS